MNELIDNINDCYECIKKEFNKNNDLNNVQKTDELGHQ